MFFPHLERRIHASCLFQPAHSSCDRYSLSSKNYEQHAFYRKHFWCFSTFRTKNIHISCLFLPAHSQLERRIYTYLVYFCQCTLATMDIHYRARIMNRTRFIESISGVFPHLERRIYTYLVCFCQRTLATINIPFRARITNRTRFIESISGAFRI